MSQLEYLIRENARLERENAKLQESNFILSRLFYYASKKLRSYRVPIKCTDPEGRLTFTQNGNTVVITYVDSSETISDTGDPILDEILKEGRRRR